MNIELEVPQEEIKNFLREITPNKDWLYILAPFSIGDFLIAGGLSYAVQRKKNKLATVLIVQERMKRLAVTYENLAGMIFLPLELVTVLDTYIKATQNYETENFIYGNFHFGDARAFDENFHAVDRFKKYVFELPQDTPLMPPIVEPLSAENVVALYAQYFLNKQRTIVLLPRAKTFTELDESFWVKMVERLTVKNFIVYTNIAGDEKPIEGTMPLAVNFAELNFIADKVKCFIGLRSGAFDFLAMTGAKIFNITRFAQWDWDINFLYPNCDNRTFYDAVKFKQPLEEYLAEKNLPPKIELHHEHIAMEDIYFSYEEILDAILNEVEKI